MWVVQICNMAFQKGHPVYFKNHSEETKKRLHDIALADGRRPDFTGRKHTKESRKIMSEKRKANPNTYWLGRKRPEMRSEEYREKMSKVMKERVAKGIHNFWKGGITNSPYSIDWTKTLKRSIRERDHYVCQLCSAIQEDEAFAVHHIDYNKLNCNSDNLITLCHNCHSKTNGNREYWQERFKTSGTNPSILT
jgi:hypothetical protein